MSPNNGPFAIKIRTLKTVNGGGALSGFFKFCFEGQCFNFPALPSQWDNNACQRSFQSLPNIKQVNCTNNGTISRYGQGTTYKVKFLRFPTNPYETNLWSHTGAPSITDFGCDSSGVTGGLQAHQVACIVSIDTKVTQPPIYEYCSRRGLCDLNSGQCKCYPGFYGLACNYYQPAATVLIPSDILKLTTTNSAFRANVLHFANTVQGTTKYNNLLVGNTR